LMDSNPRYIKSGLDMGPSHLSPTVLLLDSVNF
jgi:hypothetical protein